MKQNKGAIFISKKRFMGSFTVPQAEWPITQLPYHSSPLHQTHPDSVRWQLTKCLGPLTVPQAPQLISLIATSW